MSWEVAYKLQTGQVTRGSYWEIVFGNGLQPLSSALEGVESPCLLIDPLSHVIYIFAGGGHVGQFTATNGISRFKISRARRMSHYYF